MPLTQREARLAFVAACPGVFLVSITLEIGQTTADAGVFAVALARSTQSRADWRLASYRQRSEKRRHCYRRRVRRCSCWPCTGACQDRRRHEARCCRSRHDLPGHRGCRGKRSDLIDGLYLAVNAERDDTPAGNSASSVVLPTLDVSGFGLPPTWSAVLSLSLQHAGA